MKIYNAAKTTPIQWKSLIEEAMLVINYSETSIQTIVRIISNQFITFYQKQTDFSEYKETLLL